MAIDLKKQGRVIKSGIRQTKSTNLYLRLVIKLYRFLARRTDSKFNQSVLRRLNFTNVRRFPLGLSRIVKNTKGDNENKIVVSTATVTNDNRLLEFPKRTVCALKFTEAARRRILAAGGECITFDQLALRAPTGENCLLLRGPQEREVYRHFGPAPGARHSHTAPYVRSEGRKFERARGRR
ncbi:Ribosomal protein L18e/L15P [Pseudocohnilembus persalinus]|uniref:Ribosomal protein L18e/L15P n=1 Tax=Pseudocohnilembus persalinus TaxID=266149 RepID=A0A0V0QDC7_PSEPJ|nr:Ribosomal protein L18e/L15P [Pseudocohnilembus persalinus]|eukprot:KRX00207.1 Ribosomal protein L18e/L15P [Pseudocohnilembus persalinus]